ncbi:hypothetical protein SAMN05216251_10522 [Actinacidiphila alni]|uniref:Dynamin family protein n=1 Tax=Actinacidiphila alni TaxID=380248 RepID=A0A1I2D0M4_9ACTN|nr:hypothetical protein [Actinacidiphila alni]SFE74078.1 hypothetical protein SAMN05216251_10522 [Actinacidiphila alni]
MRSIDEMRDELSGVLGLAETWVGGLRALGERALPAAEIEAEVRRLRGLRTRSLSGRLNVGLVGRQSAGKSFLISGLQGGLTYSLTTDEDGDLQDSYDGVLPIGVNATTACPTTVVPVEADGPNDASGRGFLRVQFADSPWNSPWTDVGPNPSAEVMAAYGAVDGDQSKRLPEHRGRVVLQIELLLSRYRLPAKLYDLPGAGGADEELDVVMKEAWDHADCFIYVSHATAGPDAHDLDLMRDLYAYHLRTGRQVLWVLTGIDRAEQAEDGRKAWKIVKEKSDEYLRDRFGNSSDAVHRFIGEGFLPVSPALEAKAVHADAVGADSGTGGNAVGRNSRMDELRRRLTDVIEGGAGQRHLADVAEEAMRLVRRLRRPIADTLATHRVSVADLDRQQHIVSERLDRVKRETDKVLSELRNESEGALRTVRRSFGGLAAALHAGLDDLIDSGDLKAEHVSEINVRQVEIFSEWIAAAGGPDQTWQRQLAGLNDRAATGLRLIRGTDTRESQLVAWEAFDGRAVLLSNDGRQPMSAYGVVKTAATTMGVVSPVVGGVAMGLAGLSLAAVAFPVAATVAAAIAMAKITDVVKERESALQKARTYRKQLIDGQADRIRDSLVAAAKEQADTLIDAVEAHLVRYRHRLERTLAQIADRVAAPDSVASRETVLRLGPVEERASEIIASLRAIADAAEDAAVAAARAGVPGAADSV